MTMTDDERIEQYCEHHGLRFQPWELGPWEVDDGPSPYPPGAAGHECWPAAQRLRRQIIKKLKIK